MIKYLHKTIRDTDFKLVNEPIDGGWLEVTNADSNDIEFISQLLNLKTDDILDALDDLEIPRIERKNGQTIIFIRLPVVDEFQIYTETFTFIISDKYITTISLSDPKIIKDVKESAAHIATTQKSKLLIYILLKVANEFTNKIKQYRKSVMHQRKKINTVDNKDIVKLNELEEILNQYSATLAQMKNIFQIILQGQYIKTFEEDADLFEDLHISLNQSVDTCNVSLNSIRSIRDSYQIIFTNNLNNEIMLLTYLTISLAIPTLIGSIYGMNIPLPLQNSPHAFLIVIGSSIIGLVLAVVFIPKLLRKTVQSR